VQPTLRPVRHGVSAPKLNSACLGYSPTTDSPIAARFRMRML